MFLSLSLATKVNQQIFNDIFPHIMFLKIHVNPSGQLFLNYLKLSYLKGDWCVCGYCSYSADPIIFS